MCFHMMSIWKSLGESHGVTVYDDIGMNGRCRRPCSLAPVPTPANSAFPCTGIIRGLGVEAAWKAGTPVFKS